MEVQKDLESLTRVLVLKGCAPSRDCNSLGVGWGRARTKRSQTPDDYLADPTSETCTQHPGIEDAVSAVAPSKPSSCHTTQPRLKNTNSQSMVFPAAEVKYLTACFAWTS